MTILIVKRLDQTFAAHLIIGSVYFRGLGNGTDPKVNFGIPATVNDLAAKGIPVVEATQAEVDACWARMVNAAQAPGAAPAIDVAALATQVAAKIQIPSTVNVDVAALAKAVNDDAARRLKD